MCISECLKLNVNHWMCKQCFHGIYWVSLVNYFLIFLPCDNSRKTTGVMHMATAQVKPFVAKHCKMLNMFYVRNTRTQKQVQHGLCCIFFLLFSRIASYWFSMFIAMHTPWEWPTHISDLQIFGLCSIVTPKYYFSTLLLHTIQLCFLR